MIRKLFYLSLLFIAISCDSMPKDWNWGMAPRPFNGMSGFPSANTDYGAGFKEGCIIGWQAVGKGLMSDFLPATLNPDKIVKSADYRVGWWDGHEQCVYVSDWDVL